VHQIIMVTMYNIIPTTRYDEVEDLHEPQSKCWSCKSEFTQITPKHVR